MQVRNDAERYGAVAQTLHWAVALLVLILFGLGWYMEDLPLGPEKLKLYNLHKSIGVTVLTLVVLRIAWRLVSPPPPLPPGMAGWERLAARASHGLLYLLLLAQPLIGILHANAANFPLVVFGGPQIPPVIGPDDGLKETLGFLHWLGSNVILALVAIHVLAALRHQFLLKDGLLRRMVPGLKALALLLLLLPGQALALEPWTVEEGSRVGFTAYQEGAPVEGRFEAFEIEIRFDPAELAESRVEVVIETASVNSQSSDRDSTIRSEALFAVEQYPTATFVAERFAKLGEERYEAAGTLTLRGVTRDVTLPFALTIRPHPEREGWQQARAVGELTVQRLDYGVGQGQWRDTSVVADEVLITIDILARRPAPE